MNINPNNIRSIAILGCGGTGTHVSAGLARLKLAVESLGGRFPRVTLCDPDIVELPNVGRQLFGEDDVGTNKATALSSRINLSYGMDWNASETDELLDLNLVCVDSRSSRHRIYRQSAVIPHHLFLDFGNDASTGQVVFGGGDLPRPDKAYPSLVDRRFKDQTPSCSLAEALESQELFINQAVATYGLQLLWQIFRYGKLTCRGYFINLNGSTQPIKI